jgi:serine/threonine-protein kinase
MAFNVGDTAGDYQILSILGAGGMGMVYKARNVITDRVEALKVLLPDLSNQAELADRFMREIKVLASLSHPNIAGLHTALRLDNQLLMVMEFVEGHTMDERLKQGPIPPGEAVGYICAALSALGYAHERGVVHRDIKPANMMVTPDGELKLMDFGIAKAVADRGLTMAGTTLGSLFYMSPEQVKGSGDLDGRSDLYSVGVSLYEMVTGTRPFEGGSDYSVMVAHLEQLPKPPIQIDPTLLPALNEIILTAIQKDRENRFQSAQAFRAALESVAPSLGQPVRPPMPVAAPPPLPPPSLSATITQPVPVVRPQQPPTLPQAAPLLPPLATAPQVTLPPPPPPPVAWAEPPVAAAAQAPRAGHRGLWMALGGLIVLVLLAGAAIQGPRWYRTWAAGRGQSAVPVATPEPAHAPPDTPPAETPTAAVPEPPAAVPAATAPPVAPSKASRPSSGRPARAESGQAPYQPPQSVAPPQPPTPPAVDTGRLEELRDRLGTLGPRANAIRSSLDNLERRQQAAGYGLRGDIAASRQRMEYLLDEAQAALNSGNADRAQKNLDLADQEADKLDKFLGR